MSGYANKETWDAEELHVEDQSVLNYQKIQLFVGFLITLKFHIEDTLELLL